MLGNDLLGFHTQHHCNNFLETRGPDAGVPHRPGAVRGHAAAATRRACGRSRSASIPTWPQEYLGEDWEAPGRGLRKRHRLGGPAAAGGRGPRRLHQGHPRAAARRSTGCSQQHPELKGTFHFVQVGAPSRTHLPAYRDLTDEVQELAERINWEHGTDRLAAGGVLERALRSARDLRCCTGWRRVAW